MTRMYLISDDELNAVVRRRRLDVIEWVRGLAAYDETLPLDRVLDEVSNHVRSDFVGYEYYEPQIEEAVSEELTYEEPTYDEAANLEPEVSDETPTAIDYMLDEVEDDDTITLTEVSPEVEEFEQEGIGTLAVEVAAEFEDTEAASSFHSIDTTAPAFPERRLEEASYSEDNQEKVDTHTYRDVNGTAIPERRLEEASYVDPDAQPSQEVAKIVHDPSEIISVEEMERMQKRTRNHRRLNRELNMIDRIN